MDANDQLPIADTEVHYLRSAHVGDEFKIFVGHCGDIDAPAPAVLYIGDGNGLFAAAVDMVRLMQLSAHLPPMLVVGIGYRMAGIAGTEPFRTRDFTPTIDDDFARIAPNQSKMGGADNFLAFIRDELQPWVHARHDVDTTGSAFFGHSMGGLFATYVLLTEPDTFSRYGIGSPSLWWHGNVMFDYEARYAATHHDLDAKVFFSVGEFEDHEGRQREVRRLPVDEQRVAALRYIDMVADSQRMASVLRSRNYPSLEIESEVLPGEFHITVPLFNLSRSLRYLFDAPR